MSFQKVEQKQFSMWTNETDWVIASSREEAQKVLAEQYGYDSIENYSADYPSEDMTVLDMEEHFRMCETDGVWSYELKRSGNISTPERSWVSITARVSHWIDHFGHKPKFVASTEW